MRIGLTPKLLLILGLTSAVSVMAMALAARWSFQHGFLDYLGQQELKHIEPLGSALLEAHHERGSWDFLARNPHAWPRFIDQAMAPDRGRRSEYSRQAPPMQRHPGPPEMGPPGLFGGPGFGPPGAPPSGSGFEPPHRGPMQRLQLDPDEAPPSRPPGNSEPRPRFGPPPPRVSPWVGRLRLLDAERNQVVGITRETGEEILNELTADGAVVGWLALSSPLWLEDELAQRFNSQHNRSLLWISLVALTLAMLLGAVFGETILRRIRAVAVSARRLAKGDYREPRVRSRNEASCTSRFWREPRINKSQADGATDLDRARHRWRIVGDADTDWLCQLPESDLRPRPAGSP